LNNKTTIFETSKGLKGTAKEISKILNVDPNMIYCMNKTGYEIQGHKIINSKTYVKKYNVYQDDKLIMQDTIHNISEELYLSESGIRYAMRHGRKILGEYLIKEAE
jgi:hypothetical protein